MHHHTAAPVPFPISRLNGSGDGRIKCNINTKPDGTVWLVAYGATNYSSGSGSSVVLAETRAGKAPPASAKARGLSDDTNGNPWYWNFENDHLGNGSPISKVQWEALVVATRVVLAHFGRIGNQVIAHADWTARKIDPKWNSKDAHTNVNDIRLGLTNVANAMRLPLRLGDVGEDVRYLQTKLIVLGFLPRVTPPANHGTYDAATSKAVLAMRKSLGSRATSGDVYAADAAQQLDTAWVQHYATGVPGPPGPPGELTLTIKGDATIP
jgi:hypothetical protein